MRTRSIRSAACACSATGSGTWRAHCGKRRAAHAGGRIVMLQEGGYSLPYLPIATLGVLEGLVGWNAPFDDPHQFVQYPLGEGERAAVKAARAALAPYWPTLHRS